MSESLGLYKATDVWVPPNLMTCLVSDILWVPLRKGPWGLYLGQNIKWGAAPLLHFSPHRAVVVAVVPNEKSQQQANLREIEALRIEVGEDGHSVKNCVIPFTEFHFVKHSTEEYL